VTIRLTALVTGIATRTVKIRYMTLLMAFHTGRSSPKPPGWRARGR